MKTTNTECLRRIVALDAAGNREMKACVKPAEHAGVCSYVLTAGGRDFASPAPTALGEAEPHAPAMPRPYRREEIEQARTSGWGWWSMASNPACVSWCASEHDEHEFMVDGELMCGRSFGEWVTVWALQPASTEVPFKVDAAVFDISVLERLGSVTAAEALQLAEELTAAAKFRDAIA